MGKPIKVNLGPFKPEPWTELALCATSADPDAWFPGRGETRGPRAQSAIRVCQLCPVRQQCLRGALRRGEGEGIWGGYTTAQRNRLVRETHALRTGRLGAAA